MRPVVLISPAPRILEVIIRKNAEPAGITQRCPTGTDEVEYSNVTKTESGRECGLGHGWYRREMSSPDTSEIMRKSTE